MTKRTSRRLRPAVSSRWKRLLGVLRRRIRFTNRHGTGRVFALEAPASGGDDPAGRAAASCEPDPMLELRSELTRTLDRHRLSRSVMPALALLERALRQSGRAGMARLAAPVLWDAVNQLDVLADSWDGSRLPTLRRHLTAALGFDEADMDMLCATDEALDVDDGCLTEFMAAMDEWDAQAAPAGPAAHPAAAAAGL